MTDGSVSVIYRMDEGMRLARPLYLSPVPAGFSNPADDYVEDRIDLNRDLILHPHYTYYALISGDSMINEHLYDGSIVAFDRVLED